MILDSEFAVPDIGFAELATWKAARKFLARVNKLNPNGVDTPEALEEFTKVYDDLRKAERLLDRANVRLQNFLRGGATPWSDGNPTLLDE